MQIVKESNSAYVKMPAPTLVNLAKAVELLAAAKLPADGVVSLSSNMDGYFVVVRFPA